MILIAFIGGVITGALASAVAVWYSMKLVASCYDEEWNPRLDE